MNKYLLIFNTIKYLKFTQVYFRLFYFFRNKLRKWVGFKYKLVKKSSPNKLSLSTSCEHYSVYKERQFTILNLSKKFDSKIDWNFSEYGKLWTYNLTYFEYLKEKEDVTLIYDFIDHLADIKDGLEPFPISLRGINWIKFLTEYKIEDQYISDSLYAQYYILLDNLEYHLLGNHLLENGFSLLFGAYFFKDEVLYKKAKKILLRELEEQILNDGAHFELSPMYHQLMLYRVLDCINLIKNNNWKNQELLGFLEHIAAKMLGWLDIITYKNGNIPLVNDSANKVAPNTSQLLKYAQSLEITKKMMPLDQSGYRKIQHENYECIIDIGEVGPKYIPGHAHADTFNFEVYINDKPLIVDTGISTYNKCSIRDFERSTSAHNTVEINNLNSSQVWGGFRVGKRAHIIEMIEKNDFIQATHNGYYDGLRVLHTRRWEFQNSKIIIKDKLNNQCNAIARLHFHPTVTLETIKSYLNINSNFRVKSYNFTEEFNQVHSAIVIEIEFNKELEMELNIKGNE